MNVAKIGITKKSFLFKSVCSFVAFVFIVNFAITPIAYCQFVGASQSALSLPTPGAMVTLSGGFNPAILSGITVHPENPLEFDFIVDAGQSKLEGSELSAESLKLIKYFMAALTVPEQELWVNLSPYEGDRIIPDAFGYTEMGRDLLAQDYILKQLSSSLMYPEEQLGSEFWQRVYSKAQEKFGTTDIPVNTFNKIWIIPEKAQVFQKDSSAYVIESHLKVMLEEDYVALNKNLGVKEYGLDKVENGDVQIISGISSAVVKEVLIPEIEKEVNQGKNFAMLRQIYNSMILATWFKQNLKESLLGKVYVDQNKVMGIDLEDKNVKQKIYDQYVEAFKKGVYNYIKEDYDPSTQQLIPRKYFSGGFDSAMMAERLNVINAIDKVQSTVALASIFASNSMSAMFQSEDEIKQLRDALNKRVQGLSPAARNNFVNQVKQLTDGRGNNRDFLVKINLLENTSTDQAMTAIQAVSEVETPVVLAVSNEFNNTLENIETYSLASATSVIQRQFLNSRSPLDSRLNFATIALKKTIDGPFGTDEEKNALNNLIRNLHNTRAGVAARDNAMVASSKFSNSYDNFDISTNQIKQVIANYGTPISFTKYTNLRDDYSKAVKYLNKSSNNIEVYNSGNVEKFGIAKVEQDGVEKIVIESAFLDRINQMGNPNDMLSRAFVYAEADGSHEDKRVAEFEYALNSFNVSERVGIDFESMYGSFSNDFFEEGQRDEEMYREAAGRIKSALWEMGVNLLNKQKTTKKGRRVIVNKGDASYDQNDLEDGAENVKVGILAISANPLHWGQLETGIRAMARHDIDQMVIIVQGDDFRKPILKKTEEVRHNMVASFLKNFEGLVTYSNWSKGNTNIGEDSFNEMIKYNFNRKGKVEWHYVVGNDHEHYYAPDGKSTSIVLEQDFENIDNQRAATVFNDLKNAGYLEQGADGQIRISNKYNGLDSNFVGSLRQYNIDVLETIVSRLKDASKIRRLPKKGKDDDGFEADTIQRLYKYRQGIKAEMAQQGIAEDKFDLKIGFNIRDWREGVALKEEAAKLEELRKEGFIYSVDGINLPGTSSTKLREVLSLERSPEDASFISKSTFDLIMQEGKYRGLITKLPEDFRALSDSMNSVGDNFILDSKNVGIISKIYNWMQIESNKGNKIDSNKFFEYFYQGIDTPTYDGERLVADAEPKLFVSKSNVDKVFFSLNEIFTDAVNVKDVENAIRAKQVQQSILIIDSASLNSAKSAEQLLDKVFANLIGLDKNLWLQNQQRINQVKSELNSIVNNGSGITMDNREAVLIARNNAAAGIVVYATVLGLKEKDPELVSAKQYLAENLAPAQQTAFERDSQATLWNMLSDDFERSRIKAAKDVLDQEVLTADQAMITDNFEMGTQLVVDRKLEVKLKGSEDTFILSSMSPDIQGVATLSIQKQDGEVLQNMSLKVDPFVALAMDDDAKVNKDTWYHALNYLNARHFSEKGSSLFEAMGIAPRNVSAAATKATPVGGINLNPELLDLQIKRDDKGIPLPIFDQPIDSMKINGFLPVIINVTPIPAVPLLLGFGLDKDGNGSFNVSYDLVVSDKHHV